MIFPNEKEADFKLQLLGMNLKFDDILILLIIYILYSQEAENNSLFIILFLLSVLLLISKNYSVCILCYILVVNSNIGNVFLAWLFHTKLSSFKL